MLKLAPATFASALALALRLMAMVSVSASTSASASASIVESSCPQACACALVAGKNLTICQERGLSSIPRGISKRTNFLDMSGNRIETIRDKEFWSLRLFALETIVLDSCGVKEVRKNAFVGLKWLKELDLSNNSIASVDRFVFADNKLLEMVNLSGNPIRTVASFQFTALPMLKLLDLSNCALSVVEPEAFSNLLFLEDLSLRDNSLSTLPKDLFTWLRYLKRLDLHANPWRCDCNVQSLVILLSIRRLYTRDLSCTYEVDNKTNLWQHMEDVDLDCIPGIESSVKENLMSLSDRLHETQTQRFDVMDTGKKIFSSQSVESSFLPAALIAVAATLFFLCLVSCYAKCRRHSASASTASTSASSTISSVWMWCGRSCCCYYFGPWRTTGHRHSDDEYNFEKTCYSNFDEDCSDISLTVEL